VLSALCCRGMCRALRGGAVASRKETARIAGGLYLAYIVLTVVANATRDRLVVPGDAATTAVNVVASALLFRVSFVSDVLAGVLFLVTAWALYVLLEPVNPNVALLFVLLNLAGDAVQCLNMLNFFAAWLLPLGYLVLRSGFLPRLLGVVLTVESAAWLTYALQFLLLRSASGAAP